MTDSMSLPAPAAATGRPRSSSCSSATSVSRIPVPRVPFDTHALGGQGDYSGLRSPLLNEYKVPLELLRQVYRSPPTRDPSPSGRNDRDRESRSRNSTYNSSSSSSEYNETPTKPPAPAIQFPKDNAPVPVAPTLTRTLSQEQAQIQVPADLQAYTSQAATFQYASLEPSPSIHTLLEQHMNISSPQSAHQQHHPQGFFSYSPMHSYPAVKTLPTNKRKRILVTGGAGFVGSHLVDRLMFLGHEVTVLDNFFSGSKTAISHWVGHPHFELVRHDITLPFHIECDMIYHLACPASPRAYQYNQIKTMKTNFLGTLNMLGLAKRTKARFLLSSTSEVYGSPDVHPQPESYWGNVNPIGPRACYDEGKRVAEALTFGYLRQDGVDIRVARIFNTFGPRMTPGDGRVVSNFILQALKGEDITIYGDGSQTRSLLFVHDLIDGLIMLMNGDNEGPINIGSPYEGTILSWAQLIIETVDQVLVELHGSSSFLSTRKKSKFIFMPMPEDDPPRRKADTTLAKDVLGWQPQWSVQEGLKETIKSFLLSDIVDVDLETALKGKVDKDTA